MRQHEDCVMGCPKDEKLTTHCFPADPKRRAEWCRILGVYPTGKRVCICSAHFNSYYFFGTKLSKYALPNPPDPNQLLLNKKRLKKLRKQYTNQNPSLKTEQRIGYQDAIQNKTTVTIEIPNLEVINNENECLEQQKDNQNVIQNTKMITIEIPNIQRMKKENESLLPLNVSQTTRHQADTTSTSNVLVSPPVFEKSTDIKLFESDDNILPSNTLKSDYNLEGQTCFSHQTNNDEETDTADEDEDNDIKTGDFEIRKRDTKELIVQIRSIKTENSRMLSFVLPQKFALQQIIRSRDVECNRQYKEIKKLKTANERLLRELKILRSAMFQFRHVKAINRYLSFRLKKYRQWVTRLRKKLKRRKRIKKLWNEFCVDTSLDS